MIMPELGDMIVTRNGKRWICATSATILEKVGIDPDINYANDPIKAHSVNCDSFMTWKGDETGSYSIVEVIPAEKVRPQTSQKPRMHSEMIKAWADGAEIQQRIANENGVMVWVDVHPNWYANREYRIKPADEIKIVEIRSDMTRITQNAVSDGNHLEITFDADSGIIKSVKII